jgi:hypothetical protein
MRDDRFRKSPVDESRKPTKTVSAEPGRAHADLFEAFNVAVTYDKPTHTLELAATVAAELVPPPERLRPPRRRSQNSDIAGAGFEPATSGL